MDRVDPVRDASCIMQAFSCNKWKFILMWAEQSENIARNNVIMIKDTNSFQLKLHLGNFCYCHLESRQFLDLIYREKDCIVRMSFMIIDLSL